MLQVDCDVKPEDIQILRNPDAIVGFFAKRGYDTNKRVVQNPQHLGISNQTLLDQIKRVERIAENESLRVYLIELSSVTVANTLQLSRSFKEMSGFFILVLTSDYERIDFVLLDRVIPIGKKLEVTTKPRFALRPRSLTVNRSNLDTVSKKVLRRLTFTESDEFAQYEKIRSAYTMADWTEDFFNNRALFSDYFLIHRLKENPVWKEKAESSYLAFKNKLKPFSSQWHNIEEEEFFSDFIEPVLAELGFEFEKVSKTSAEEVKPHYILLQKLTRKKVGAMLSYRWGRHLDAKDYTRDNINPEENPSQAVVTVLEEEEVPWVIVTNGKTWRLYSAKAHSRATNYYEIDLEETIALDDPSEAFRYYWLLFREDAFIPRSDVVEGKERKMSFLDKLLYDSQEYSKELEKELKKRVFEEVFPFFAEGFIQTIGGKEKLLGLSEDERDAICRDVFPATLTILYRLLFLLYAESRDLLPGKEVRGYYDKSLTRLKKEIGRKAGNTADDVESKLKSSYTKSNTELYDRLMELAKIIDKGKSSLNVPTYNGGLFLTELTEDDDTREAEIARFLTRYKIPDYYLAIGLDKLARVEDSKKFELVPIDYKSLGVRQLGSIYEGLLEFNVRIAPEKMAVVKGKRTEQVVPYVEAVEKELRILTNGRGSEKREYTLPRGAVYIENDKKERKATGSYYTPDYIVKYIVENAVGPVLEEKFKGITPKLRTLRPEHVEMEGAKEIIDDLFDINVLDPAMGSGHFLVETVDYITDKMLHFLNGFPNNPVQLELQRTRDAIMEEMNRQGVSIDQNKLIDVSLMKRHVLKRCVYGVDLNPMAVELAKVSLWLDCFTLGAPLSYLDHHLKCGNSLIGASLKEAEKEIESGQMTIWATSKFGGVKRASEHMIQVGELSDITTNMIEESKKEYCKATREIEPYKRLLDIYASRWFSNSPIVAGTGKKKKEFDYALDFLRSDEISEWLKDISATKHLDKDQQQIVSNALTDVTEKRFFHWILEFPEIFCGKEEERGFDVVIGNPPYDEVSEHYSGYTQQDNEYFTNAAPYSGTKKGRINLYRLFMLIIKNFLRNEGRAAYIVPLTILSDSFSFGTRKRILETLHLVAVDAFPQKDDPKSRVFPEAKQSTCIIQLHKSLLTNTQTKVRTHPGRYILKNSPTYCTSQDSIYRFTPNQHAVPLVSAEEWQILEKHMHPDNGSILRKFAKIYAGEICDNAQNKCYISGASSVGPLILRGSNINRYELLETPKQGVPRYLFAEKWLSERGDSTRGQHHNNLRIAFQKGAAVDNWRRLIVTVVPKDRFCFDTIGYIPFCECKTPYAILSLLNSKLWEFRFLATSTTNHINAYELEIFKVPSLAIEGYESEHLAVLAQKMLHIHREMQIEIRKYIRWLEKQIGNSVDKLSNKTTITNFIGDYQKREEHLDFSGFYSILQKNRNRLTIDVDEPRLKEKIQLEYQKSISILIKLKENLQKTDAQINKIVYKLYNLRDKEIEIVEKKIGAWK